MTRLLAAIGWCMLLLLPLAVGADTAAPQPPAQQWYTVLLDGRKIGSFESRRTRIGDSVLTMQRLDLVLDRAGSKVAVSSTEAAAETLAGEPLAFHSVSRLSGAGAVVDGLVVGDEVLVSVGSGSERQQRRIPWPDGALLPEGMRLAAMRAGLAPGTRYRVLSFQPSSLDTLALEAVVGEGQSVDLPGGMRHLVPVTQRLGTQGMASSSQAFVDASQAVYKLTMPLMGLELTLLACDRDCATAPNQGVDVFEHTLARSPRPLGAGELADGLRYTLVQRDAGEPLALPATGQQSARREGTQWIVTVRPAGAAGIEPPGPDDYRANDWLQSDAPEIAALAAQATAGASDPHARMQRIEAFVRGFIRSKNLGVGYASALEVARHPEGDCTEHALLVAALGRASGIATRIVNGLAYAPGFAGGGDMFVPHAWAQAWVNGRWQGFDAALAGFDAGHIALATGDGDPWRFYAGLDMLGRIRIERAEALPATPAP
jgi:hypothetical protein